MKYITDIKKLEGRTIEKAKLVFCDESLSFIFTDGSFANFSLRFYGESFEIYLSSESEIDDFVKVQSGFMTQEELDEKIAQENKKHMAEQEAKERKLLEQLKIKYEGG